MVKGIWKGKEPVTVDGRVYEPNKPFELPAHDLVTLKNKDAQFQLYIEPEKKAEPEAPAAGEAGEAAPPAGDNATTGGDQQAATGNGTTTANEQDGNGAGAGESGAAPGESGDSGPASDKPESD